MLEVATTTKQCGKCLELLDVNNFRLRKPGSHLYQSYCRPCERQHWRNWRQENQVSEIKRLREYYGASKKRILAYKKESRRVNNDLFLKREKINRERRGDLHRLVNKKWRDANLEKVRAYAKTNKAKRKNASTFKVEANYLVALKNKPCFECGNTGQIHIDHIVPISRGGNHSVGNLMPLCASCNLSKGAKTYMEWRVWKMKNARKP